VEFWQTGVLNSQVVYFLRVRHMTNFQKHEEAGRAIQKVLNGGKLSARYLASVGKIQGTLRICRLSNLQKSKSVITHWAQLELHRVSRFAFSIVVRKVGSKPEQRFRKFPIPHAVVRNQ
jgi:hypothetical protein